jgi:hypothetical protein
MEFTKTSSDMLAQPIIVSGHLFDKEQLKYCQAIITSNCKDNVSDTLTRGYDNVSDTLTKPEGYESTPLCINDSEFHRLAP